MTTASHTVTVLRKQTIKAGDDYCTVEVALTLDPGATDDDIAQALATAGRMDAALADFVGARAADLRAAAPPASKPTIKDPTAPASGEYAEDDAGNTTACKGGQFGYLAKLIMDAGWEFNQIGAAIRASGYDPTALTKGEASDLIEAWQEQAAAGDEPAQPDAPAEADPADPAATAAEIIAQIEAIASRYTGGFAKARAKIEAKLGQPLEQATAAELQPFLELLQNGNGTNGH
ncbi:MAG: hypothetical protein KKB13_20280 [Chloroflexi bacterium]|nr:hypothetical protein [Chloroflexota bacterium]